jgi:hypothetical protein
MIKTFKIHYLKNKIYVEEGSHVMKFYSLLSVTSFLIFINGMNDIPQEVPSTLYFVISDTE